MGRRLRAGFLIAVLASALTACDDGPTGAEGGCIALVNVHGVFFSFSEALPPDPSTVASVSYLTISRNTGCLDQGEPSDPLVHGEANFLEVGTTLHEVEGYTPTERLVIWSDVVDEWLVLEPVDF